MERLFFVGIKHSGKTTFAKRISRRFGYLFFDSDELISRHLGGKDVREFYRENGKEAFMSLEKVAVRELVEKEQHSFILSLGGGASDNESLMQILKNEGKIIYLTRGEDEMLPVILKHGIPAFLDKNDLEGSFHRIYTKRDMAYREYADSIIDLGKYRDRDETEAMLYSVLKELGYGV